jgi:hypothetical protein
MQRKLLFFDIDGTLVSSPDTPVPDSTKEALARAKEKGHYIFINTGRPKSLLPEAFSELDFDGYLCGCGSYITLKDEIIIDKQFAPERCKGIVDWARQQEIPLILEGNDFCYIDSEGAQHPMLSANNNKLIREFPNVILDAASCDDIRFSKFCAMAKTRAQLDIFLEPYRDYFEVIDRGDDFYEIVPIGFSKASAIDQVLAYLDQSLEDCYVFGDSSNDLSMLSHVPNSIAMGNSDECVLQVASYITTPVWRDGIYVAMKHFELI